MLVDPNKICSAIGALSLMEDHFKRHSDTHAAGVVLPLVKRANEWLTECINQGYGDRSEPTTYAGMLASARSWAQDRIAELKPYELRVTPSTTRTIYPDADDREQIVNNAAKNALTRLVRNQALVEVFMSRNDLVNVDLEDQYDNPAEAMMAAVHVALIEDMQDLVEDES